MNECGWWQEFWGCAWRQSEQKAHTLWKCKIYLMTGFPDGAVVKNPPANAGDSSWIPRSGRYPGVGNGNPLQYFCLKSPMERSLVRYSPWGHDTIKHTHTELLWWRVCSSECVRWKLKAWLWSLGYSSYQTGAMSSSSSLAASVRNLIPQFSEIQAAIMSKNLGKVSFSLHLLLHPKQTQWCLSTLKVSTCVGVLENPEVNISSFYQGWLH